MLADLGDPLVRRAHERANAVVERDLDDPDDRLGVLEADGLSPRLLFRHVVDAEELIVTQQQSVHLRVRGRARHDLLHGHAVLRFPNMPRRVAATG